MAAIRRGIRLPGDRSASSGGRGAAGEVSDPGRNTVAVRPGRISGGNGLAGDIGGTAGEDGAGGEENPGDGLGAVATEEDVGIGAEFGLGPGRGDRALSVGAGGTEAAGEAGGGGVGTGAGVEPGAGAAKAVSTGAGDKVKAGNGAGAVTEAGGSGDGVGERLGGLTAVGINPRGSALKTDSGWISGDGISRAETTPASGTGGLDAVETGAGDELGATIPGGIGPGAGAGGSDPVDAIPD